MKDIALYGAGGHAKVIINILRSSGRDVRVVYDDNPDISNIWDIKVSRPPLSFALPLIISIGDNRIRKLIDERCKATYSIAVAPSAIVAPSVEIYEGSVVMQGAIIQPDSIIGRHCIVNTGASIDHECIIGDFVHISPHATLCGNVTVDEGSWIGAGAIIIPGVKIGKWCKIGAGAVIRHDVPDNSIAYGNPPKIHH